MCVIETAVYVDDLARSREFYGGLLGFTIASRIARMVVLKVTDDQVLLLFSLRKGRQPRRPSRGSAQSQRPMATAVYTWRLASVRPTSIPGSDGCATPASTSRAASISPRVGAVSTFVTRTAMPSSSRPPTGVGGCSTRH